MKISKQARRDARELFQTCLVGEVLDENRARQAVTAVIQKRPHGYHAILSHFERLIRLEIARHSALVESAIELPPQAQTAITADLTRQYGAGLAISFTRNPALIGGVRIKVGGDVYDGSVQGRLAALQQTA